VVYGGYKEYCRDQYLTMAGKKYMRRSAFKFIGVPVIVLMLFFAGVIWMANEYDDE
jgi:amino acid permease